MDRKKEEVGSADNLFVHWLVFWLVVGVFRFGLCSGSVNVVDLVNVGAGRVSESGVLGEVWGRTFG